MKKISVAIIGVGRFGANYLRTLNDIQGADVRWICSSKQKTLDVAALKINLKSDVKKTTNYKDILKDKNIDAVIISTPGSTHYQIAKDTLSAGMHALVEKPICLKSMQVEDLIKISKKKK